HRRDDAVQADAGAYTLGLGPVPLRGPETAIGVHLPPGVLGLDPVLGVVPRHVGVGVEVLDDRLLAQPGDQVLVGVAAADVGSLLYIEDGAHARVLLRRGRESSVAAVTARLGCGCVPR